MIYKGLFRLPNLMGKPSSFAFGGDHLAYRPTATMKGNLLVSGHDNDQLVAAITIPEIVNTRDLSKAKVAPFFSKNFVDITGGYRAAAGDDIKLGGMIVYKGKLYWSLVKYYNVDGFDFPNIGYSNVNLSAIVATKPIKIPNVHSHRVSGYFIEHSIFNLAVGRSNRPGYGNRELASEGPCAYTLSGKRLLDYSTTHPFLDWKGANSVAGGFDSGHLLTFVARIGMHATDYYGEASDFPGPGKPCSSDKGYHAPPYKIMMFEYGLIMRDTDLSPYFLTRCKELGGLTYDRANKRLYVVEKFADPVVEYGLPIVHCWEV